METHELNTPVITRETVHGNRSFGHKLFLEEHPEMRDKPREGLREYIKAEFSTIADKIQLYSPNYLYNMLPDVNELDDILIEFNHISDDDWKSDDIMGWMYEYYNRTKREEFKSTKDKIEYQWVSLTSQYYTPRWVVEFLLNNSLGKLWMEMHPNSKLKDNHDIANCPEKATLTPKPVTEIKVLDPAVGSGNFLLYAFELFFEMYEEELATNFTNGHESKYTVEDIPRLIIENNIYGVDLDDRAIQIAQLGLYIKSLKHNTNAVIDHTNVVSTDFYLPEYDEIQDFFADLNLHEDARDLMKYIWDDLRMAHKFGSLIRIEERFNAIVNRTKLKHQTELFAVGEQDLFQQWESVVIPNIKKAVEKFTSNGNGKGSFFQTKTLDSLTFVDILRNKFDVVVANPPYTPAGDFGKELKTFIDANYKKPHSFHSNLYSAFLKRNSELLNENGKISMISPLTFMYIKSYEDVRNFILKNYHINALIEFGIGGIFMSSSVQVDVAGYILEKNSNGFDSYFMNLQAYKNHSNKNKIFKNAYLNYLNGVDDKHNHTINQAKLTQIKSSPFIYWISDKFREKFGSEPLDELLVIRQGGATGNNIRFIRFWWEVNNELISIDFSSDSKKWVPYAKGGPYEKWHGNYWTVLNYDKDAYDYLSTHGNCLPSEDYYFLEGITYCSSGSKGTSFRHLPTNSIISGAGPGIYAINKFKNMWFSLGFLNSSLSFYISDCLNPTVNITQGDIKRIPFAQPSKEIETQVSQLAQENVTIKKHLCEFSIIEMNYIQNPLIWAKTKTSTTDLRQLVKTYLDYENEQLATVYMNEAKIDALIFEVYDLTDEDRQMVLDKEGVPIGDYAPFDSAQGANVVGKEITDLYEQNKSLEEICEKVKINPMAVVEVLKNSQVLPPKRMNEIAQEFLFDAVREVLEADDDGIIPLVKSAGETPLQSRLFDWLITQKGLSNAQVGNFGEILGKEINDYLLKNFFTDLCNRLNLFMYLPKTPFIWHLSAGSKGSFEAYISIYKWNRDKLYRLRSVYVSKRESSLRNRLIDLQKDATIQGQAEREKITDQLEEIDEFKQKIDAILQSGYEPKLDDGVGKNIAPLQEKGMLKSEVLKKNQLKKYLEADW